MHLLRPAFDGEGHFRPCVLSGGPHATFGLLIWFTHRKHRLVPGSLEPHRSANMSFLFASRIPLGGRAISQLLTSRAREQGGTRLNLLLAVIVLGSMAFAGVKLVPPYFAKYQMEDSMQTEARFAVSNNQTEKDIREDIWRKVKDLGIPAKQEDILIHANQGIVKISLSYTVPIDLLVYQFNLDFHLEADNRTI